MRKTFLALVLGLCCLRLLSAGTLAAPTISARRAIVTDALSGAALYEKDADAQSRIASTTKILTALVVAERCDPDEIVVIPPAAAGIKGSSMDLRAGERLTVRELLYGLLLVSGNDAAAALAIHCAGSEAAFAALMNEKARELGAADSRFVNPHGLDAEGHFSTARDLTKIAAAAMDNPLLREITSTKRAQIGDRTLVNHNKLLWRGQDVVGVKTGYTRAAGRILVSAAERDGRRLIAVTIDDPDD